MLTSVNSSYPLGRNPHATEDAIKNLPRGLNLMSVYLADNAIKKLPRGLNLMSIYLIDDDIAELSGHHYIPKDLVAKTSGFAQSKFDPAFELLRIKFYEFEKVVKSKSIDYRPSSLAKFSCS
jgi:hypothetical protein